MPPEWSIDRVALLVEPSRLGNRRSRGAKDDAFLACALASHAEFIVTKAKDLLALKKPFGVETITPGELNRRVESTHHGLGRSGRRERTRIE